MKKALALALALVLLLSLAACGTPHEDGAQDSTTTTTTSTTTAGDTTTATGGTDGGDATAATVTTTTTTAVTTTTTYVPGGATVPIGTKPTTTTTTKKPTTTTTVSVEDPVGPTTAPTTQKPTATTTTTATTVKPTQPPVSGPYIALPEIGSDIDVTKKKNRIRVSAVAAWYNDDGSIGVSLTFKNYTTNWITEETDYVEYICYDKNGNVVQKATKIMIGVIDTKKHPVREYVFSVPAATAEVRITRSKIVYWTEWS